MKKKFIQLSAVALTAAVMAFNMSCNGEDEPAPVLSINPVVSEVVFTANGLSATSNGSALTLPLNITVSTNQGEFVVEKTAEWLEISNKTATGFRLSVKVNETIAPREDNVTVKSGSAPNVTFKVKQSAGNATLEVTPSDRTINFSADGTTATPNTTTYTVETNSGPWTVVSDKEDEWLSVEKVGTNQFKIVAAENKSLSKPAAATVTVSAGAATAVKITVTQDEAVPYLNLSPTTTAVVFNLAGTAATSGSLTYTVETNSVSDPPWDAIPNQAWLTVTKDYANNTFTLSAPNNEDFVEVPPPAEVDVKAGSTSFRTLEVSQPGNPNGVPKAAASVQIWTVGNQKWTDYIEYDGKNKTDLTTYNGTEATGDYRNAGAYKGYLYSWFYVDLNKAALCPSPWRVPSKDDFIELDLALGGNGTNEQTGNTTLVNKYISDWGAIYSGYATGAGALTYQGSYVYAWSSDEANTTQAYYQLLTNTGNVQPFGYTSSQAKPGARPVRCVK